MKKATPWRMTVTGLRQVRHLLHIRRQFAGRFLPSGVTVVVQIFEPVNIPTSKARFLIDIPRHECMYVGNGLLNREGSPSVTYCAESLTPRGGNLPLRTVLRTPQFKLR
ncbi:hypothetical protein BUALT_Bualt19G0107400 [Buddleja alternifolia]|uniref:Uncharacterized protein n=1 Tax=Buddleja alternifolia TaxID=168488 RepID=A0AAV6WB26_9LAMI|nr:hypothetical protein BUALT_Bualt19G0107400 [Buddleja alternifolia]